MARPLAGLPPVAHTLALLAAIGLILPTGCGFKIEKRDREAEQTVVPRGFESPLAAFEAIRKAYRKASTSKDGDFKGMMEGVTDSTAQVFAGHVLISGAIAQATGKPSRPIRRTLSKHGIDNDALEEIQEKLSTQIRDPAAIYELTERIKDQRLFVAEMMKAFNSLGRSLPIKIFDAEVTRLEIQGDRAIGLIEQDGELQRIAFRKNDLGWQLHIPVPQAKPTQPPVESGDAESVPATSTETPDEEPVADPEAEDASDDETPSASAATPVEETIAP